MFRETLLESAVGGHKRKRWPMAIAFTLELLVGALLVALPLLSTGIIPVSARVPLIAPRLEPARTVDNEPRDQRSSRPTAGGRSTKPTVIPLDTGRPMITIGEPQNPYDDNSSVPNLNATGPAGPMPRCEICIKPEKPRLQNRIVRISVMEEGRLIHRVEPVYPRVWVATGIRGEVRLHAIIAKDGSIQSLTLISGHPVLAQAAEEAVKQWRYRPYLLNGEAVEVETFITVNFNRGN
jgi:periplasmic protein TonB